LRVARLSFREGRTSRAAVGRRGDRATDTRLRSASTSGRAGRPGRPGAHHAVDGAGLGVALLRLRQGGACRTTVRLLRGDGPCLPLRTAAARGRASRPRRPSADLAIDWAGLRVARLHAGRGHAVARGIRHLGGDGGELRTTAAPGAALEDLRPGLAHQHDQGARARGTIARTSHLDRHSGRGVVGRDSEDLGPALRHTAAVATASVQIATGFRPTNVDVALAVIVGGQEVVHAMLARIREGLGVTLLRLAVRLAAILARHGTRHHTATALLVASRPATRLPEGARLRVAPLRLLQHGASRAAVGRGAGDGARLRLDTTAAPG